LRYKNLNLFLNYSKNLIDKINEQEHVEIDFDNNLLTMFKKIIIKSIKKLLLYRSKDTYEAFDFILNINNYPKYYSYSKKNLIIFAIIIYIFHIIIFHDSKSEANQIILNNYFNDLVKLMCNENFKINDIKNNDEDNILCDENIDNSSNQQMNICGIVFRNYNLNFY